jgi:putative tryptophan/tyrosine transport system substrate-binding protein
MFVGGAAAVLPHATHAQEAARIYRLGVMSASKIGVSRIAAFFDELRLSGFVEGQNLKVDGGGYGLRDEQLPEIVAAMAKSPPDVIFCATAAEMRAADRAREVDCTSRRQHHRHKHALTRTRRQAAGHNN